MIDIIQYRVKIGNFNSSKGRCLPKGNQAGNFGSQQGNFIPRHFFTKTYDVNTSTCPGNFINNDSNIAHNIIYFLYLYFILVVCTLTMLITLSTGTSSIPTLILSHMDQFSINNNNSLMYYVKCFYCILIHYAIKFFQRKNNARNYILYKLLIKSSRNISHSHRLGRLNKLLQSLILWLCILNFLLITVVNPSLLNPGPHSSKSPKQLSVHYQNVQGLIPFGQLKEKILP